jgi:hypothetical protein
MRFILALLLTALLAIALGTFLPWWSIAIAAFSVALVVPENAGISFLAGFMGVFVGWSTIAMVRDAANEGILSHKIAAIFPLGGSSVILILISGFIGALVGGFAALAGSYLWRLRTTRNV